MRVAEETSRGGDAEYQREMRADEVGCMMGGRGVDGWTDGRTDGPGFTVVVGMCAVRELRANSI